MAQPTGVRVRVPASTANLGPGFDTLGLALNLATTIEATYTNDPPTISISGEGAEQLSRGPDNLVYQRMQTLAQWYGLELPPIRLHIANGIPLERGLGASGAASLAGLLAADALLQIGLARGQLLDLACQLEGHPDNVTPSLLGGCTVSAVSDGHVTALNVPLHHDLICAVCIPNLYMPTKAARQILPEQYSRADAIFNLSRTALLITALTTRRYDALRIAVEDRLHQPYRAQSFPALTAIVEAAHAAGAYGAFLSGAGSTIAALAAPSQGEHITRMMTAAAIEHGLTCRTQIAQIDHMGATVAIET